MTNPNRDNEYIEPEIDEDAPPGKLTKREVHQGEIIDREPPMYAPQGKGGSFMSGGVVQTIVIALIVSVIVIVGMGMMGGGVFVTKKDFDVNISNMSATISQMRSDLIEAQDDLSTAISNIPGTVNDRVDKALDDIQDDINNLSNKINNLDNLSNQVTSLQSNSQTYENRINEINSSLTSIKTSIASLEELSGDIDDINDYIGTIEDNIIDLVAYIDELTDMVLALEEEINSGGGGGSASGEVLVSVKQWGEIIIPSSADKDISAPIKIKIENGTSEDISDVVMTFVVTCETYVALGITNASLSGANWVWINEGMAQQYIVFQNTWGGISVGAGESKTILATLFFHVVNPSTQTIYCTTEIMLEDYE